MQETLDRILEKFEQLCSIPHASRHEQRLGRYLLEDLRRETGKVRQDETGNVMAEFPATPGLENAPTVILQAHMDMVLAGAVPPEQAAVHTVKKDGLLFSDGRTSLGADNGAGLAVILALLEDRTLRHGPLRALFTVREEIGLEGARSLDPSWLEGAQYLINTDGFHADTELIGCKGGLRETISAAVIRRRTPEGMEAFRLRLSGFLGGHSGDDIDKGRLNAIQALAQILRSLGQETELALADIRCGTGYNVIPSQGEALVLVPAGRENALRRALARAAEETLAPYRESDGAGCVSLEAAEVPAACYEESFQKRTLRLLLELRSGVCVRDASGTVLSSCNLGWIREERSGILDLGVMLRCDTVKQENELLGQHRRVLNEAGCAVSVKGYHGWHSDPHNPLAEAVAQVYEKLSGTPMKRQVALVGVEPALFHEKAPSLDIVCLAAEIQNAHSVEESVELESLEQLYRLIAGVLPLLAESARSA